MNAYELADKLKKGLELGINSNLYILDAVTMLRQQQAENDKLRYEGALLEIENNQLRDNIFELRKANEK